MKKLLLLVMVAFCAACVSNNPTPKDEAKVYQKKYTNADYYKDGKIQVDVVVAAYKDMLDFYGLPWSADLEKNIWITDFELGDFENAGMAGIFWVNDSIHSYFGHEIYLLPGQMIPEHAHVKTKFPAKFESWRVIKGWCYNFGIGEASPDAPAVPASQVNHITAKNCTKQQVDQVLHLKEIESPHFLYAGDEGAVVSEYASYHDGEGLRFTNPGVVFTDMLTQ